MRGLIVTVAVAAAIAPRPAAAQPDASARVEQRLARGQALFRDLEYKKAIRELQPVPVDPAATRAQRLRALELVGLSHLILGEEARAREAFEDLLAIDPGYQLRDDTGSPKIRDFFDRVKKEVVPGFDASAVAELDHAAPPGATGGRPLELEAGLRSGADKVTQVVVVWRQRGQLAWRDHQPMRRDGPRWRARFTAPPSARSYVLEYYLEAQGPAGQALGRAGGPETPLSLRVAAGTAASHPWYGRWYVIASGAAAVSLGAILLFSGDSAGDGTLPPGHITLSP